MSTDAPRLSVLGTPLHPILSDLPATFLTTAPVFDLVARRVRAPGLDAAGFWMELAGVLSAGPTALAGLLDYRRVREDHDGKGMARIHGLLNSAALATAGASLLLRRGNVRQPSTAAVGLGLAAAALTTVSAHLGGELVYKHGFRVDAPEPERVTGP